MGTGRCFHRLPGQVGQVHAELVVADADAWQDAGKRIAARILARHYECVDARVDVETSQFVGFI